MSTLVDQLEQAVTEIRQSIDAMLRSMRAEFDRNPTWFPDSEFRPYAWLDRNNRPILADLLAAQANLLAALARLRDTPEDGAS